MGRSCDYSSYGCSCYGDEEMKTFLRFIDGSYAGFVCATDDPLPMPGDTYVEGDIPEDGANIALIDGKVVEINCGRGERYSAAAGKVIECPLKRDMAISEVDRERQRRLSASDWIVTRSIEQGSPVPEEWAAYRQALRDLDFRSDPLNVVWPSPPANA